MHLYRGFVDTQLLRSKQVLEARVGRTTGYSSPGRSQSMTKIWKRPRQGPAMTPGSLLGNRTAMLGTDMFALPRFWISDSDRTTPLAAMLSTACSLHLEHQ